MPRYFQQKDRVKKKSIAKNYFYNIGYQILILILPLITTPYVSRILGPDGVGRYGLTNSISQYFVLFGCVGLNLYGQREIAYHQTDTEKKSVIFFELLLIRLIAMSVSIVIFWLSVCQDNKYSSLYRIELFELVAALLDITWFFQGMEEFKKIVIRNSIVKLSGVLLIFLLVKSENDTTKYTAILVLTVLIGNILMWLYLPQYIQRVEKKNLNVSKHIKPALLLFIPQIATSVYNVLDKSMIGLITESDAEVAYYEQAQKIIKIALAMPVAVGTVMLPRMASLHGKGNSQEIKNYIQLSMRFVCMLTFPLCFGIIGIAKDFVPWFYGAGFDKVYDNLLMIAPIIILVGISNVLGVQYLLPINRQKDYTKSVIIGTTVNFTLNALLIPSLFSIGAAVGSIIAEGAVTITQIFLLKNEFSIKQFLNDTYKYIFGSFIMIIPVFLYSLYIGKPSAIHTVIEICIGVLTYSSYLLIIRDDLIYNEAKKTISWIRRKREM